MTRKNNNEKENNLEWHTKPPVDLPGPFLMEMENKNEIDDINSPSEILDQDFKMCYEDPMDCLDIFEELNKLEDTSNIKSQIYKKEEIIDKKYYLRQNERSEIFTRFDQQANIDKIFDYKAYLAQSFDLVEEDDSEIAESYPLFCSKEDNFVMIVGDTLRFKTYKNETQTTVVNKITIDGEQYNLTLQSVEKYLCINIKEENAYFSPMTQLYKLNKS